MNIIPMNSINELSFPDISVIETKWIGQSHCIISLNGAILEQSDYIKNFESCRLHIELWDNLEISCYNHELGKWVTQQDELIDICEIAFKKDLIIRGFGVQTGLWVEYDFKSPQKIYAEVS